MIYKSLVAETTYNAYMYTLGGINPTAAYSRLSLIWSPLHGTVQLGRNSEVAVFQEIAADKKRPYLESIVVLHRE